MITKASDIYECPVKRILIADDSTETFDWQTNCISNSRWLKNSQITHVKSLSAALRECYTVEFDMAILDLCLEDVSGFSTFPTFRRAFPDIPVFVFSALIDVREAGYLIHNGAVNCAVKPNLSIESDEQATARYIDSLLTAFAQVEARRSILQSAAVIADPTIQRSIELLTTRVQIIEDRWPTIKKWCDERLTVFENSLNDFRNDLAKELGDMHGTLKLIDDKTKGRLDIAGKVITGITSIVVVIAAAWAAVRWR